jgi:hypothetical protein
MNSVTQNTNNPASGWRQSKWLAFLEFAIVAAVFIADRHHLIPISKTPFLLLLAWLSLRIRKVRWRDVGFTRNRNKTSMIAIGIGAGLVTSPTSACCRGTSNICCSESRYRGLSRHWGKNSFGAAT